MGNARAIVASACLGVGLTLHAPGVSADEALMADSGQTGGAQIVIRVAELRVSTGYLYAALYRGPRGFPIRPKFAIADTRSKVEGSVAVVRFENVPPGEYAVSLFHDENDNHRLDTNFFGLPKEGVGASNGVHRLLGPPRYRDAKFELGADAFRQTVTLQYL